MKGVFSVKQPDVIPHDAVELVLSKRVINKLTLLDALARACAFPDYFGYNWDGAWDLIDENPPSDLWLQIFPTDEINEEDWGCFLDLISDAFQTWGAPKLWLLFLAEGKSLHHK